LWSLAPTSAAAERNWSAQGRIFSETRTRLTAERGTKLVSVYWNLRALYMYDDGLKERAPHSESLVAWRRRLEAHSSFPHKEVGWEPTANYGTTEPEDDEFVGMHGDEDAEGHEEDISDEEGEEEAPNWAGAAACALRPAPASIPADLRKGDVLVVYFHKPHSDWFIGVIDKVDPRSRLPVSASFDDGAARLFLDADLYGVKDGKQWALLTRRPQQAAGAGSSDIVDLSNSDEDEQQLAKRPRPPRSDIIDDDD
jgi:hypothetical protein